MGFLSSLKIVIKKLDLMTNSPNLKVEGNDSYQTVIGGLVNIGLIIVSIIGIVYFGRNMINKTEPMIVTSSIEGHEVGPFTVRKGGFNIFLGIEFPNFTYYMDDRIYTINATLETNEFLENGKQNIMVKLLEYDKCNNYYTKAEVSIAEFAISNYWCFKPDQASVEGYFGYKMSTTLKFYIEKCENTTSNNNHCRSEAEINSYIQGGILSMFTTNAFLNLNSPEEPVKIKHQNWYNSLNLDFTYDYFYNLRLLRFEDDTGFLLENINIKDYPYFENPLILYYGKRGNLIATVNLLGDKFGTKYKRSYTKIQDLLTRIGGLLKAFALIATFISNLASEFEFYNISLFNFRAQLKYFNKKRRKSILNLGDVELGKTNNLLLKSSYNLLDIGDNTNNRLFPNLKQANLGNNVVDELEKNISAEKSVEKYFYNQPNLKQMPQIIEERKKVPSKERFSNREQGNILQQAPKSKKVACASTPNIVDPKEFQEDNLDKATKGFGSIQIESKQVRSLEKLSMNTTTFKQRKEVLYSLIRQHKPEKLPRPLSKNKITEEATTNELPKPKRKEKGSKSYREISDRNMSNKNENQDKKDKKCGKLFYNENLGKKEKKKETEIPDKEVPQDKTKTKQTNNKLFREEKNVKSTNTVKDSIILNNYVDQIQMNSSILNKSNQPLVVDLNKNGDKVENFRPNSFVKTGKELLKDNNFAQTNQLSSLIKIKTNKFTLLDSTAQKYSKYDFIKDFCGQAFGELHCKCTCNKNIMQEKTLYQNKINKLLSINYIFKKFYILENITNKLYSENEVRLLHYSYISQLFEPQIESDNNASTKTKLSVFDDSNAFKCNAMQ